MLFSLIVVSLFLNFVLYLNFEKISKKLKLIDYPDKIRKIHKEPTPVVGGFFILLNFLILSVFYIFAFDNTLFNQNIFGYFNNLLDSRSNRVAIIFFIFPLIFFFIGYLDDRFNLSPNTKFINIFLIILIGLFIDENLIINQLKFNFINKTIYLKSFSLIFTAICILILINALNMFDGINLQSITMYSFLFIYIGLNTFFTLISIYLFLQLIILSFKNYKGKIFLGNGGNIFLSFIVSFMIIKSYNLGNFKNAEMVFLLLCLPGLDLIRLFFTRILNNRHPFSADKNHLHHFLIYKYGVIKTNLIILNMFLIPNFFYYLSDNFLLSLLLLLLLYFSFIYISKN